jgi:hypothetical protein
MPHPYYQAHRRNPKMTTLICDCNQTMPLDASRLGEALNDKLKLHSTLCRREVGAFLEAIQGGDEVVVACTQEKRLFTELAGQTDGAVAPIRFVNIRETGGWSKDAAQATPKIAALLAAGNANAARRWWPIADAAGGKTRANAWALLATGSGGWARPMRHFSPHSVLTMAKPVMVTAKAPCTRTRTVAAGAPCAAETSRTSSVRGAAAAAVAVAAATSTSPALGRRRHVGLARGGPR